MVLTDERTLIIGIALRDRYCTGSQADTVLGGWRSRVIRRSSRDFESHRGQANLFEIGIVWMMDGILFGFLSANSFHPLSTVEGTKVKSSNPKDRVYMAI